MNSSSLLPAGLPADPALLPTLLDLLPMGVIYYAPVVEAAGTLTDLELAYLNPAAQRMTGLPAQPATTYRRQFPTTDDNGAWDFHRRSWLSGAPQHFQFYYAADGFDSYFRVAAQRLGAGLLAIFTDTQDEVRTQAEQALLASQARERERTQQLEAARAVTERERAQLHALLTQAPVALGLFTGDELRVSAINPLMADLLGYAPAQLLGQPLFEQAPELQGQGFDALMRQVQATRVPFVGREAAAIVQRHGAPAQVYFNFVYQPLCDADDQVIGIINVAVDVTEQVVARQQLQQLNGELEARIAAGTQEARAARAEAERQRSRLVRFFQQAPAAICVLDGPELVYELVNPGYQQLFPGRALLGKPLLEALPELTGQPVWQTLQQVYQTGETHQELGICIPVARHENGPLEDFYFNYVQQARYDEQGRVDGVLVFATDITEQALARQQVQLLNEELAAINQAMQATNDELHVSNRQLTRTNADLDTFVYTASHDLKAPITNIEGLLLALRRQLPPEAQQAGLVPRLLELMQGAIVRFQQTLGHLTEVSRLHYAQSQPAEAIDLAALVEDVRLDMLPELEASGTTLAVEVANCPTVHFSLKNLRSIVYNLLSNAVKYHAPDRPPQVQVRCHCAASGSPVLAIQDNGLGLSEQQQGELFHMFRRLHAHVEGSGVGLYMVKKLLENAGGTIAVQSQLGVGTTFTVTLPAAP